MNGLNIFEKEQGQETGDKKQGTRDREQETGDKKQGTRNREQEAGKQKTSSQTDPPNSKPQTPNQPWVSGNKWQNISTSKKEIRTKSARRWQKYMHRMNRISLIMFLVAVVIIIFKLVVAPLFGK
jgi:hypothetical protein